MKDFLKGVGIVLVLVLVIIGLSYAFGLIGVHQTKTIGKAKQNAETTVFYETQSFVSGKKQEALKLYQEYNNATDDSEREAIRNIVSMSFAEFDESKLNEPIAGFVSDCKY